MSRSYKKNPITKDTNTNRSSAKFGKRTANRVIRNRRDILNNGTYKKAYCSWCICDYKKRMTQTEFQREWEIGTSNLSLYLHGHFKSFKQALLWWKKYYRNKQRL